SRISQARTENMSVFAEFCVTVMKQKVLIIVQNCSVPSDPRVVHEARSLRANGYDVIILSPRHNEWPAGYEVVDGIRIYRHPTPREGSTALGYVWEYGWALFWEF